MMNQSDVKDRHVLLFIPGYYGTALRDVRTQRRVFITAKETLFGKKSISLSPAELLTPDAPELEVDGILKQVRVIPGIYKVDVYEKFLKKLASNASVKIVEFPYDWRQDLVHTAHRLHETIVSLRARGVRTISIAAHSMGGLITTYYLAYGNQELDGARLDWRGAKEVDRIVYFGVPFQGVFAIFRNMNRGVCFSGNCNLLPAETVASFPASYQLMNMRHAEQVDRSGTSRSLDLSDLDLWKSHQIGLFGGNVPLNIMRKREEFTKTQLDRAKVFSKAMDLESPTQAIPKTLASLNVVGVGRKTLRSAYLDGNNFIFDQDNPKKHGLPIARIQADGDGTVTSLSAQVPEAMLPSTTTIQTNYDHGEVFLDPKVLSQVRNFLKTQR